jgi:hypothetical protein
MVEWRGGVPPMAERSRCASGGCMKLKSTGDPPMHTLLLSSALVAFVLIVGPYAAVAQNEGKAFCLESPSRELRL